jgi:hypothetical protein
VGPVLGTSTVPVRLTWSASTSGTVTAYQLRQSVNGGAFADVTPQPGNLTKNTLDLAPGNSYRFQV